MQNCAQTLGTLETKSALNMIFTEMLYHEHMQILMNIYYNSYSKSTVNVFHYFLGVK